MAGEIRQLVDLTDRQVLVTGASSGIGKSCAITCAQLGASVLLNGRNKERLSETREEMCGDNHTVVDFDLSNRSDLDGWLRTVAVEHGVIDGLIHMAGIHDTRPLRVANDESIDQMLTTNVGISLALARAFRHKKVRAARSSIVFASSIIGLTGQAGVSAYSASKGAIISLTKSLALELAAENVRVNCVCPSIVETEMTTAISEHVSQEHWQAIRDKHPLGFGQPDDVAGLCAFLTSDAAKWITGSAMVIDGGYSLG